MVIKTNSPKDGAGAIEKAIEAGVEAWISEHLRNTAFSRDTEAWNVLQEALPKLPGAIIKEVK